MFEKRIREADEQTTEDALIAGVIDVDEPILLKDAISWVMLHGTRLRKELLGRFAASIANACPFGV